VRQSQTLLTALAASCLLVGASGCHFQRTGHGFIVGSQWSLELNTANCLAAHCTESPPDKFCLAPAHPNQEAKADPELLRWRSRLMSRLAATRLQRNGESGSAATPRETTPSAPARASRERPAAVERAVSLSPCHDDKPTPSASGQPIALEIPSTASSLPERRRPDLVLD
jgi:hypothetical protein